MSEDALTTILELVVSLSPPVVVAPLDESVHELRALDLRHQSAHRHQSVLQVLNQILTQHEAWQIILAHEHHLY